MLIYLPFVDGHATLLAGFDLNKNHSVEVTPEDFGDVWPMVVAALSIDGEKRMTLRTKVATPTVASIIAAVQTAEADKFRRRLEEIAAIEERLALARHLINAPLSEFPERSQFVMNPQGGAALGLIPQLEVPYLSAYAPELGSEDERVVELVALRERIKARVGAENERRCEEARPRLLAQREREVAEARAKREALEAQQATQLTATKAERLATGHWERETRAYNQRRFSKPWCARVTGVDARGKLVYEWGQWSGRFGDEGLLRVACKPGEIIAWGQRDNRSRGGEHELLQMQDDGGMDEVSVLDAVKILRARVTTETKE